MKKLLLAVLFLLSHMPCQATQSSTSELQKCIGATALLLSTLSNIEHIKDEECTKSALEKLKLVRKELDNRQVARDLCGAIIRRDYKLAIRMLKDNPNLAINARFDSCKTTVLVECCWRGDESINVVKKILKHPKFDITMKNIDGETYLHHACYFGTFLITNSLFGREDIVKILHAKNNDGCTPLDYIVWRVRDSEAQIGHINIWNMLVVKGAQLSYYKKEYERLNSDEFNSLYNSFVSAIKSNPPRKVNVPKKSFLGQNTNSN